MRFTRLHLILILIILAAVGLYVAQYKHKPAVVPEPVILEELPINREPEAKQVIAIAGEYWKIAKKRGCDLSEGQSVLRQAKDEYQKENYEEAINLAKKSIEILKTAPRIGSFYTVHAGDCLWNIALMERHYGRGAMWVRIWRANEEIIPDFDLIRPRQKLFVPKKGGKRWTNS